MVRDDGLTVDNANAVCKKLSWIIINFYKALALFPGVKKAFGLSDAEFNTCPKEALAYAVNRASLLHSQSLRGKLKYMSAPAQAYVKGRKQNRGTYGSFSTK